MNGKYKCKRCKYEWIGRKTKKPLQCPRCKSYSWEERLPFRPPLKTIQELKKRAKNKCEICGSTKNLEIHHIKSKQQGINHNLNNLQLLCEDCHSKVPISYRISEDKKIVILNVGFEDKEYKELIKKKKSKSWHNFIMELKDKK